MHPVTKFRTSLGLSQAAFARKLGLKSRSVICEIEGKDKPVSVELALSIEKLSEGALPADRLNGMVKKMRAA